MSSTLPQAYHNSKTKAAVFLLVSLLLAGGGGWMAWKGEVEDRWIGWVVAVFFMIGVVVFVRQFLDRAPRLTLTAVGITDRTLRVGEIPWTDIEDAQLRSIRGSEFICLHLRNTDEYLARLPPILRRLTSANTALGFTPLSLNLTGLKGDTQGILATVLANVRRGR